MKKIIPEHDDVHIKKDQNAVLYNYHVVQRNDKDTGWVQLAKVGGKKPKLRYVDWDTFNNATNRLDHKIDIKFNRLDSKFNQLDTKFDRLEKLVVKIAKKVTLK